jgi:hypothetical protein
MRRTARRLAVVGIATLAACGGLETPLPAPPSGDAEVTIARDTVHLHSAQVVRTFALRNGAPRTTGIANRLAGGADLPLRDAAEFVVTLGGGRRLTDADFTAVAWTHEASPKGPAVLRSSFRRSDPGLAVEVTYALDPGRGVIRKQVAVSGTDAPVLIDRLELERFTPARPATAHEGPGQPVYVGDLFWGCEHPAAENVVRDGAVSLGFLAGVEVAAGIPAFSRTSVVGAAFAGRVRDGFFEYLEGIRPVRVRPFVANYTRFDLDPYDEDQAKKAIAALVQRMVREYATPCQAYVLDEGWDAPSDPWVPDPVRFPRGLDPLRKAMEGSGMALGLRLTAGGVASGGAPAAATAKRACLGDAATRRRLLERTASLLREQGVSFLRIDGFAAPCSEAAHGHRVGAYAGVAAADAVLEALAGIRQARPDVFLLLGDGFWPSPWWLAHADALWRGDADYGFSQDPKEAPRRERWVTFVDAVLHRELRQRAAQVPLRAIATGAIVHGRLRGDRPELQGTVGERDEHVSAWEHMAVLECARGTRVADLYLSHAVTTRDQWSVLATWLRWAREHDEILAHGAMAGGDPSKGKPYAFVHALPGRAVVAARNPSDREQILTLPVDAPPFLFARDRTIEWTSAYPDKAGGAVKPGAPWTTVLPPYGVRVAELKAVTD